MDAQLSKSAQVTQEVARHEEALLALVLQGEGSATFTGEGDGTLTLKEDGVVVFTGENALGGRMEGTMGNLSAEKNGTIAVTMRFRAPKKGRDSCAELQLDDNSFTGCGFEEE